MYINGTGNPYMAVAGMGDTLTGLIASLVGRGYELFEAAIVRTYLHGLAGDEISQYKKPVLPTDIIDQIGFVLAELIGSEDSINFKKIVILVISITFEFVINWLKWKMENNNAPNFKKLFKIIF
ncbi:ADP-dependent NAD(P)H-hydrate dehydratase [Spiroplasma endosymbiont of Poecilobothrus nobilitatus]|uniref:ADP-dependent NAD(P)H-hydrate dehydratase n=1 Tax=Spiroplasma endosymbiont of Poecilobothrus nobilitatus TaxID=1209220 RepID=UPI00313EF834